MPCYHPIKGFRARKPNPETGKRPVVFNARDGYDDLTVNLPCGRCIGCRLERSRQWAIRCVHEASLHENNCFITLTFDDKYLDVKGSLVKADFQKFMKRLRKHFGTGIRYFHCGEYGEKLGRPHHHACLFNLDFPDKILWQTREGIKLYRSKTLEDLWPFGHSTIGGVTFESAAYVARYVTKKIIGKNAASHYGDKIPEYVTMSRRPGLARGWLEKYTSDVYPSDFIIIRGKKCKVPKYYDRVYELTNPKEYGSVRSLRISNARGNPDNSPRRLEARERVQQAKMHLLERPFEAGN